MLPTRRCALATPRRVSSLFPVSAANSSYQASALSRNALCCGSSCFCCAAYPNAVDDALRQGHRGLSGGSSLLLLLAKKRGVRNPLDLPPLSKEQILGWADHHFQLTGAWPKYYSGAIADAPGETWAAVDSALRLGKRGLLGGSSLAKLLVARGIVRGRKTRAQHAGVSCEAMKI